MIAYRKEKLENAIVFFIQAHMKKARKKAFQTFMYKYLALFEFFTLERTGRPALDLDYYALEKGPVPKEIYDRIGENCLDKSVVKEAQATEYGKYYFEATADPDLAYFSEIEIDIMQEIVDTYIRRGVRTDDLIQVTHKRIRAWQIAWEKSKPFRSTINFDDTFPGVLEKDEAELTDQEEVYLLYKGAQAVHDAANWESV